LENYARKRFAKNCSGCQIQLKNTRWTILVA
jgi:hypothetical protein